MGCARRGSGMWATGCANQLCCDAPGVCQRDITDDAHGGANNGGTCNARDADHRHCWVDRRFRYRAPQPAVLRRVVAVPSCAFPLATSARPRRRSRRSNVTWQKEVPSRSSTTAWGVAVLLGGLTFMGWAVVEIAGVTSSPAPTRFIFAAVSLLVGAFFSVIGYGLTYFATTGRKSRVAAPTTRVARALIADRRLGSRRTRR